MVESLLGSDRIIHYLYCIIQTLQHFQQRMGACQSKPQNLDSQFQKQQHSANPFFQSHDEGASAILSNYRFLSNYEDQFLGRASVVQDHRGDLFLCKQLKFDSNHQCHSIHQLLQQKRNKQSGHQQLLRLKEVIARQNQGFISDSYKIILILEYPLLSLKKQFCNRMLNRLEFDREQITKILYSCIRAYAELEREGISNDKVRMGHIFVGVQSKQSMIKAIDCSLLSGPTNLQSMLLHGHKSNYQMDIYLSPEQFSSYFKKNNIGSSPNSGVFSLGITILDLCLMESCSTLYHFERKNLDPSEIANLLKIASKKHGSNIQKFLQEMLQFDPLKRPSFTQLEEKIPKLFSQAAVGNSLRLSTLKPQASKFIDNDVSSLRGSRSGSVYSSRSSQSAGRVFASSIKPVKPEDEDIENIHEQYTNGNQYVGQKKAGQKHGQGKYIFKDRSYYEGGWRNNMMHGKGILYLSNGKTEYEGQWAEDEPDGWGIYYSYSDPPVWRKYEGQLRRGEMEGRGKLLFANGLIYEGEFRNGKIFGNGRCIAPGGGVFEKNWELQTPEDFLRKNESLNYEREI